MVTLQDIVEARARIAGHVIETPFIESRTLGAIAGCRLFLKFENLQFTASFKERGALNRLSTLTPAQRAAGVIAVSAGNHAQGVAHHATRLGIPAVIVMPSITPHVKVDNTRRLGATVELAGESFAEARTRMHELASQRGMTIVHPYDDPAIIAGQGTLGLEMLEQQPDLDVLVVAIGGGGLLAGIATAVRAIKPGLELIGVQSNLFPAAWRAHPSSSRSARTDASAPLEPSALPGGPTIAEGIAVDQPGSLTQPILDSLVDDVVLVNEADIERAIVLLLEIEKTVVEGAGAAGLAAVLREPERYRDRKVGLVLCGGNIDLLLLADIMHRSLVRSRRLARLSVSARDTPGSLARVATILGDQGANIEEVMHQRAFADLPVRYVRLDVVISTRGTEHLEHVLAALNQKGFEARVIGEKE